MILASLLLATALSPDVDAYIESARKAADVPGLAIAVVDANGVVAAKGYGLRRLGSPELVDADTRFDIASLSKSFNAAMIATVVDEGKLRWDDRVRDVLPSVVFPDPVRDRNVTLRDLLTHRVGLESGNLLIRLAGDDRATLFRKIRGFRERSPFRGEFLYSNVMYSVSGAMAEAVTGKTWSALVSARLLIPLGMTASNSDENLDVQNAASPHAMIAGVQQPIRHWVFGTVAPASGIVSSANDMAKWLRFQFGDGTWNGKRIVSAAAMELMHSVQTVIPTTPAFRESRGVEFFGGYGLGWNVMDYHGHPMIWHSGNADGIPSYMAILPKEKIGVFVTINTWRAPALHGAIAARILDSLLGLPTRDYASEALASYQRNVKLNADARAELEKNRVAGTSPSAALGDYAGKYADNVFGDMNVALDGDHLTLQFSGGQIADVSHWQHDTFAVHWRDRVFDEDYGTLASFLIDENGKPSRFEMQLGRDRIEAKRR